MVHVEDCKNNQFVPGLQQEGHSRKTIAKKHREMTAMGTDMMLGEV